VEAHEANAELVRDCELVGVADEEEGGENQGRQHGDGTERWYDLVELKAVTGGFRLKNALAAPTCESIFSSMCAILPHRPSHSSAFCLALLEMGIWHT
jgi:hypothetical protein